MNVQQFNTLSQHDKLRDLLINSVCIGERANGESGVLLFQLDNFYMEVFFAPDNNEILYSLSFVDTDRLMPYLEQVNLAGVL